MPDRRHSDVSLDAAAASVVYGVAWRMCVAMAMLVLVAPVLYAILALTYPEIAFTVTVGITIPIISWMYTVTWSDSSAIFNDLGRRNIIVHIARWGALAWLLYGVLATLEFFSEQASPGSTPRSLIIIASLSFILGLIQLMFLGIVLERISRWMRDDFAMSVARFLTFATGVIVVGSIGGFIVQVLYRPGVLLLQAVSGLVMFATALGFIVISFRFLSNGIMGVFHMHHNRVIDRRRAQRQEEHEAEMAARSAGADPRE